MDTKKLVEDKLKELQPLYDRMDDTRDRLWENSFKLKNPRTDAEISDAVHVTMPTPRLIHNTVKAYLLAAKWQVTIDGSLTDPQKTVIRRFLEDAFVQADNFLADQGRVWLFDWLCDQVTLRSYIGVRWLAQFVDDEFVINCRPADMRFCPFEYDSTGLAWACPITQRTARNVMDEPWARAADLTLTDDKLHEIWDVWHRDRNEIWVDKHKVWEQENPWGFVPVAISKPAVGSTLEDTDWLKHDAEDVFYLVRDLFDEENRIVSIEQTKAMEPVLPAYQEEVPEDQLDGQAAKPPPKLGQTDKAAQGMGWKPIPRPDITNAFERGREDISIAMQAGGANDIDLGNVNQNIAALWITTQAEIRRRGLNPRLKALAREYELSARILLSQAVHSLKHNQKVEIGGIGKKRSYSLNQLKDPKTYAVSYSLSARSDAEDAAKRSEFLATKDQLDMRTRLGILGADDPDKIMRQLELEQAKTNDPALDLIEKGIRFIEEADALDDADDKTAADIKRYESMVCCDRAIALMTQRETMPAALPADAQTPQQKNTTTQMIVAGGANG